MYVYEKWVSSTNLRYSVDRGTDMKKLRTGPDLHKEFSIDFYVDTSANIEKFNFLQLQQTTDFRNLNHYNAGVIFHTGCKRTDGSHNGSSDSLTQINWKIKFLTLGFLWTLGITPVETPWRYMPNNDSRWEGLYNKNTRLP